MENLEHSQLSNSTNEINHPKMGKLKISNHLKEQLHYKFGKSIEEVASYFHNFKHQSGIQRCPHLRVIDQKISAWTHPNSDYLYCKGLNMAIPVDRDNKVMITVLHLNTDYYKG